MFMVHNVFRMKNKVHLIAVLHQVQGFFFKEIVNSEIVSEILEVVHLEEMDSILKGWLIKKLSTRNNRLVMSVSYCILPTTEG
jgi:hypothetical protein